MLVTHTHGDKHQHEECGDQLQVNRVEPQSDGECHEQLVHHATDNTRSQDVGNERQPGLRNETFADSERGKADDEDALAKSDVGKALVESEQAPRQGRESAVDVIARWLGEECCAAGSKRSACELSVPSRACSRPIARF